MDMAVGVIKKLSNAERSFYDASDVMFLLDVSRDKAYRIIRKMRQECIDAGRLTSEYPQGKVPKRYFNQQCMLD